eukprot:TRINITY_DN1158_c0_g1_i2.p2 TRINITY_DN1158_c0_g1~~TRINITY_DN1158_c0_g1_i2.p2  ORF type:complete len:172 (+),score=61.66 TRINITY_DN1158_c0_g1_i2:84-599(+)
MLREVMFSSYMSSMSATVGTTCDMGKEGRTSMDIGGGWTEHERPDGKKFYVHEGGKRTWQRPTGDGIIPVERFDQCGAYVKKMKYDGRYPVGFKTVATDGYDCETFLSKLYDMNEQQWEKTTLGQTPGQALPVFGQQAPAQHRTGGHAAKHEPPLFAPMDRWQPPKPETEG